MLKVQTFGECPLRGVEGKLSGIPDIRLPGGINIIKCKKKNKGNTIRNISGFYIGFLFLPSKVIYP